MVSVHRFQSNFHSKYLIILEINKLLVTCLDNFKYCDVSESFYNPSKDFISLNTFYNKERKSLINHC